MRHDLFSDRKSLHIKMDKSVHASFRAKLFKLNLSMQEVFEEFARLYNADDSRVEKIIDQLSERKLLDYMAGLTPRKKRNLEGTFTDLDHDTLYDLISRKTGDKNEE